MLIFLKFSLFRLVASGGLLEQAADVLVLLPVLDLALPSAIPVPTPEEEEEEEKKRGKFYFSIFVASRKEKRT